MGGALRDLLEALTGYRVLCVMVRVEWQHGLGLIFGCAKGCANWP